MKDSHIFNNKQLIICKDIKIIIDNYSKEYNQYINEYLFTKFVKKFLIYGMKCLTCLYYKLVIDI